MPRDLRLFGLWAVARRDIYDIYVIELACSLRIGKIFVEFLSEFLSEPKKLVQLRIHFNAGLFTNLRTAKHISISKCALQRQKKGTNDFH